MILSRCAPLESGCFWRGRWQEGSFLPTTLLTAGTAPTSPRSAGDAWLSPPSPAARQAGLRPARSPMASRDPELPRARTGRAYRPMLDMQGWPSPCCAPICAIPAADDYLHRPEHVSSWARHPLFRRTARLGGGWRVRQRADLARGQCHLARAMAARFADGSGWGDRLPASCERLPASPPTASTSAGGGACGRSEGSRSSPCAFSCPSVAPDVARRRRASHAPWLIANRHGRPPSRQARASRGLGQGLVHHSSLAIRSRPTQSSATQFRADRAHLVSPACRPGARRCARR